MAPSPRQNAPPSFQQAWHETDTVAFDPSALPLSKAPRAWERKAETKTARDGKQKKIWRRYPLRSQPGSASSKTMKETPDTESRSRAVKKLRVRSDGTEDIGSTANVKTRAARGTRWDRRKSVLPRKKNGAQAVSLDPEGGDNAVANESTTKDEPSDEGLMDQATTQEASSASEIPSTVESSRRTSLFTFTVDNPRISDPVDPKTTETNDRSEGQPFLTPSEAASPNNHSCNDDQPMHLLDTPRRHTLELEHVHVSSHKRKSEFDENTPMTDTLSVVEEPSSEHEQNSPILGEGFFFDQADEISDVLEATSYGAEAESEALDQDGSATQSVPLCEEAGPGTEAIVEAELEEVEVADSGLDLTLSPQKVNDTAETDATEELMEEFTETSLQLHLQRSVDVSTPEETTATPAVEEEQGDITSELDTSSSNHAEDLDEGAASPAAEPQENITNEVTTEMAMLDDIADGLTLGSTISLPALSSMASATSPEPSRMENDPEEVTTAMPLDDDTALLKDFLSRAAQSRASKATNITRRESLQNRRDSDAVRHALASPRKILEDKDPNSPSKYDNDTTLDLSQTLTLNMDQAPFSPTPNQANKESVADEQSKTSRRSSRTRKSRLPAPASLQQPAQGLKNIRVGRADGTEPITLKRTEAQEIGNLTRNNTRKNKQGAAAVSLRLLRLKIETLAASEDATDSVQQPVLGKKNVQWDETLTYYQEEPEAMNRVMSDADRRSLETPDELSLPDATPSAKPKSKGPKDKNSTPKMRRVRGLGASNGTPGKGLLASASSFLPDEIQDEMENTQPQRLPKPSKVKKMRVAAATDSAIVAAPEVQLQPLPVAPVGIEPTKQPAEPASSKDRKSRLATPRKVRLPKPMAAAPSLPADGKENQQTVSLLLSPPKKGRPVPSITAPAAPVVESGLPRRRPTRRL
ncbi:hypothetical protein EJ04DRAFT_272758 [Polyplosphaeria fusca]|uniref:Uncharacterized protein n=1 Tax=Polyplosphaeria fusca TaxID=682080 RepID=A0A9P4V1U1_9PLEO|nr:hypothetical protein EJ04DRAFT_272758 [Polyplosphaeria fusca]